MGAKGYTTAADVSEFLGVAFTPAQESHCNRLIESTEIDIDNETQRGWLVGAQTAELHYQGEYASGRLYLRYWPVASITAIRGRSGLGDTEDTLTVDEDYEIESLERGRVRLVDPSAYDRVSVDYTPVATVPASIRDACAEWVAARMQPHLRPDTYGLQSLGLPDLQVTFAKAGADAVPEGVKRVLDQYREWS